MNLRDNGGYMQLLVPNQPSNSEILRLLCAKQLMKVATKKPRKEEFSDAVEYDAVILELKPGVIIRSFQSEQYTWPQGGERNTEIPVIWFGF